MYEQGIIGWVVPELEAEDRRPDPTQDEEHEDAEAPFEAARSFSCGDVQGSELQIQKVRSQVKFSYRNY